MDMPLIAEKGSKQVHIGGCWPSARAAKLSLDNYLLRTDFEVGIFNNSNEVPFGSYETAVHKTAKNTLYITICLHSLSSTDKIYIMSNIHKCFSYQCCNIKTLVI